MFARSILAMADRATTRVSSAARRGPWAAYAGPQGLGAGEVRTRTVRPIHPLARAAWRSRKKGIKESSGLWSGGFARTSGVKAAESRVAPGLPDIWLSPPASSKSPLVGSADPFWTFTD